MTIYWIKRNLDYQETDQKKKKKKERSVGDRHDKITNIGTRQTEKKNPPNPLGRSRQVVRAKKFFC
jgi:hypothetical protein